MNRKTFFLSFIITYTLISLPAMLGIGSIIDWVPEATFIQKFKGYIIEGFINNYLIKLIVSFESGIYYSRWGVSHV